MSSTVYTSQFRFCTPPKNVKVIQIIRGPFQNVQLVERFDRATVANGFTPSIVKRQLRHGIPDAWSQYSVFNSDNADQIISKNCQQNWQHNLDMTATLLRKPGLLLAQGIPNAWKYWPDQPEESDRQESSELSISDGHKSDDAQKCAKCKRKLSRALHTKEAANNNRLIHYCTCADSTRSKIKTQIDSSEGN